MVDESTDIACTKNLCIIVHFYDPTSMKIENSYWDFIQVPLDSSNTGLAEVLFNTMMETFTKKAINKDNIIGL